LLSNHVQQFFGYHFQPYGSAGMLFLLSSAVYFYGGYPFFAGLNTEFRKKAARHDDARGRSHNRCLRLQLLCDLWLCRHGLLLGAGHFNRYQAPRSLDRDSLNNGSLARPGAVLMSLSTVIVAVNARRLVM